MEIQEEQGEGISVIITAYNAEHTIAETLSSIFAQTWQNFEVIAINDGSTDNTSKILHEAAANDQRVQVFDLEHVGRARALNCGRAKARYKWVAILDADDIWHPDKLQIATQVLYNNSAIDVLCTEWKTFKQIKPEDDSYEANNYNLKEVHLSQLVKYNHVCHSSVVYKNDLPKYDEKRATQIDYELWLRLAELGKTIVRVNKKLTYHRVHEKQYFERKANFYYRLQAVKLTQHYAKRNNLYLSYLWIPIFYLLGYFKQQIKNILSRS